MEANNQKTTNRLTSSASRAASNSSGDSSVPQWIVKALLNDIERAGGISQFDLDQKQGLSKLLDHRSVTQDQPEYYGLRGTAKRAKISQKVKRWKALINSEEPQKYLKKLRKLGVEPAFATQEIVRIVLQRKGTFAAEEEATREAILEGSSIETTLKGFESLTIVTTREEVSDLEEEENFQEPPLKRKPAASLRLQKPSPQEPIELPPPCIQEQELLVGIRTMSATAGNRDRTIKVDTKYPGKQTFQSANTGFFLSLAY
jgi:hypothetical protein